MEYVPCSKLSAKIQKKHQDLLKKFSKSLEKTPDFFKSTKIPPNIKKEIESTFPKKMYGNAIDDYIFEGWDLRSLLECSMNIGYHLGKNQKKVEKNRIDILNFHKKIDQFELRFEKNKRSYRGFLILKIEKINTSSCKIFFKDYNEEIQNKEIQISFKKAVNLYVKWENQIKNLKF